MPRPQQRTIVFSIDGREVEAPENIMLVDGAKHGDIEIPVFCYEPKLGQPVGACRMCLVEIEGVPKLQTACSTPIKDGMVVHTQTERVREAQEAVVEFLLINHPLDCPVCDKGGECPLQDISFGWGSGRSRFIDPKRHFRKPLELSPVIAIDRERCILCYRCVRFSQEVSEDYQLVLLERGAHSFVGTFDGHPYVAPFSGNIVELCPVGALTSRPYRFRARPWDIEGAGSVCTLCPSQCNVDFTVRDEHVLRVLSRDHEDVDDGWLCDKGRFAYQSIHVDERITDPLVRDGGVLRPVSWERALTEAVSGLARAGGRAAAVVGGQTTNEEGFLLARLMREGLGSGHLDSRPGGALPLELHRALATPDLQASVPDLEYAHAVLVIDCEPVDDAPILDLRLRKGVRRNRVKLAIASSRPSALADNAVHALRYDPGCGGWLLAALDAALSGGDPVPAAAAAGSDADAVRELARLLRAAAADDEEEDAHPEVVIVWGERLAHGPGGEHAVRALLNVADRLGVSRLGGAGLLEVPAGTNGRGLREAGVLPNAGPGLAEPDATGGEAGAARDTPGIARGLADGDLSAVYLLHVDPLRSLPDRATWERALAGAATVVAHASFVTEGLREHADVVFPAESYAEKEGTIVHPDGRLQRLRPAIARPGQVRMEWQVLSDIAARLGLDLGVRVGPMATAQLIDAVPFYAGLTLEQIGGRGVRWPERAEASAAPPASLGPFELEAPPAAQRAGDDLGAPRAGALRLGTYRSIWASPEVEVSPSLHFA
ncbi:MAG TPA: NADH-quinone oxidoreductase subunit NuoG, partial [Solirubrobacteraceae bacterium]|nr:NADH-quinone oxidoreductase subunit NuoG [Solirubrobacteraceae bacterium]